MLVRTKVLAFLVQKHKCADASRAAWQELFAKQEAERVRLEVHPLYLLYYW